MIELVVESERRAQLLDITQAVNERLARSPARAVLVFVPHTTAGVLVQVAGPGATKVAADVETALERLVDERAAWQHAEEGDRNPWAHVRAALVGSSVTVPLEAGRLALGPLQALFFCDLDGPRERRVRLIPL